MIGRMFFIIIFILMDLGFLYILIDSIRNRKLASQKIQATFKRFEKHSGRHYSESSFPVFSFEYNGKKYTSVAKEFGTFVPYVIGCIGCVFTYTFDGKRLIISDSLLVPVSILINHSS